MSPEQEQQLRQKMIAMAGAAVAAHAPQSEAAKVQVPAKSAHTATKTPKLLQPNFQSTQMRVFDLTNTNDAILILTATATLPQRNGESGPEVHYFVTCVARQDVNGDLHKALVNVTDSNHMDVIPRLDLIDAVDVDGDGRGELLFRKVSDDATGYVIYRVIGDQLYPLFESALS